MHNIKHNKAQRLLSRQNTRRFGMKRIISCTGQGKKRKDKTQEKREGGNHLQAVVLWGCKTVWPGKKFSQFSQSSNNIGNVLQSSVCVEVHFPTMYFRYIITIYFRYSAWPPTAHLWFRTLVVHRFPKFPVLCVWVLASLSARPPSSDQIKSNQINRRFLTHLFRPRCPSCTAVLGISWMPLESPLQRACGFPSVRLSECRAT